MMPYRLYELCSREWYDYSNWEELGSNDDEFWGKPVYKEMTISV
jgi:hypothetical protein